MYSAALGCRISCENIHKFLWNHRPRRADFARLEKLGVNTAGPIKAFMPGFDPQGWVRFGVTLDPWPVDGVAFPEFVDVVKVSARDPQRFRLMLGNVDWLGEPNIYFARLANRVVRCASNPLDWLRLVAAGERPVCFVGEYVPRFQEQLGWAMDRIICSDTDHAAKVYKWLRYEAPKKFPKVTVLKESTHGEE